MELSIVKLHFGCFLAASADENVTRTELHKLAKAIQSCWDKFALDLDPEHFTVLGEIATIKLQQPSPLLQAHAMLESWHSKLANNAHCRLLIEALVNGGQRKQANEVFGENVVNRCCPDSESKKTGDRRD